MKAAIGRRIAEARNARGLTGKQLAEAAGMDNQNLSKIENGRQSPMGTAVAAIADVLDVSTDWILLGRGRGPYELPEEPNDPRFPWLAVFLSSEEAKAGPRWKRDRLRRWAADAAEDASEGEWAARYRKLEKGGRSASAPTGRHGRVFTRGEPPRAPWPPPPEPPDTHVRVRATRDDIWGEPPEGANRYLFGGLKEIFATEPWAKLPLEAQRILRDRSLEVRNTGVTKLTAKSVARANLELAVRDLAGDLDELGVDVSWLVPPDTRPELGDDGELAPPPPPPLKGARRARGRR